MDVRLQAFANALEGFTYLANVDTGALAEKLDPRLIDGIENGKAQKFEYTLELGWKAVKHFLKQTEGVDEASPKKIVKAFYLAGHMGEDDYMALMRAIDDRNKLSHIYEPAEFSLIVARLPGYAILLAKVLDACKLPPAVK